MIKKTRFCLSITHYVGFHRASFFCVRKSVLNVSPAPRFLPVSPLCATDAHHIMDKCRGVAGRQNLQTDRFGRAKCCYVMLDPRSEETTIMVR